MNSPPNKNWEKDKSDLPLFLFNHLMQHTADHIYFKDTKSRFIALSDTQARRFGLNDSTEGLGKTDFDFFGYEHAEEAFQDERALLSGETGIVSKVEKETWKTGAVTWVSTTKLPLKNDQGKIIGTFGVSRDVTREREAEEALNRQNQNMQQELKRARIIQSTFFPKKAPEHPLFNIAFSNNPMEAVGGDYLAFHLPPEGNDLGFFIGDVTGHGVSAALYMALLKFLSDQAFSRYFHKPIDYITHINERLFNRMPNSFVTAQYAHFQFLHNKLQATIINAGHTKPFYFEASTGILKQLKLESCGCLGLFPSLDVQPLTMDLRPSDRLFFYTDGLEEVYDREDVILGSEGLLKFIAMTSHMTLGNAIQKIRSEIDTYRGTNEYSDDTALIGFEVVS